MICIRFSNVIQDWTSSLGNFLIKNAEFVLVLNQYWWIPYNSYIIDHFYSFKVAISFKVNRCSSNVALNFRQGQADWSSRSYNQLLVKVILEILNDKLSCSYNNRKTQHQLIKGHDKICLVVTMSESHFKSRRRSLMEQRL